MIKTLYKNAMSLGVMVVLWTAYSIGYLSIVQFLDGLTAVVFLTAIGLQVEDIADKTFNHRDQFTWQYVVLAAFVVACAFLWVFLARCATWPQLFGRSILLLAAIAGTLAWCFFAYRVSLMSDDERKVMRMSIIYRRLARKFPKMSDAEVRDALEGALFCRLQDDSLAGRLLVGQPFVADLATLNELLQRSDSTDNSSTYTVINQYIDNLITSRNEKETN